MRRLPGGLSAVFLLLGGAAVGAEAPSVADPAPSARVEARSESLVAIGVTHGDRMSIHVTRVADNAPVGNAIVTVLLRGTVHPTVAQADGGYTMQTPALTLPGSAAVEFSVTEGSQQQKLKGMLAVPEGTKKAEDGNNARQLAWWVLNFAVCIGFLMLMARRRKKTPRD